MARSILALLCVSALAACGGTGGPGMLDGGGHPHDGSTPGDGGGHPHDAGDRDAGTTSFDAGPADPCGGCPSGTSCGTANGIAVCRDDLTGIPRFTSVIIIVMENMSLDTITSADNTTYLQGLMADWASGSDYHGVDHPSLPNYLAMTSGMDTSGIGCDCQPVGDACTGVTCNAVATALGASCGCPQAVSNLGDQLDAAGLAWRDYGEDMGTPCNTTTAGNYAARHVPFLYYDDVREDSARCTAHVVDYSFFDPDGDPQAYSIIAPNLTHDGHDPFVLPVIGDPTENLGNADTWLSENIPSILASSAFLGGGLLVIVWDEDDFSGGLTGTDDPIAIIVMSPFARSGGFVSDVTANHYSLLATVQDGLGLDRLGRSADAEPLSDYFPDL